jgi:hypothetical protein
MTCGDRTVVLTIPFGRERLIDRGTFFLRAAVRRSVPDFLPADFFLRVVFFLLAMRGVYHRARGSHRACPTPSTPSISWLARLEGAVPSRACTRAGWTNGQRSSPWAHGATGRPFGRYRCSVERRAPEGTAGDVRSLPPVLSQRVRAERAPGTVVAPRLLGADMHVVPQVEGDHCSVSRGSGKSARVATTMIDRTARASQGAY